ncbi:hypothetical protein DFH07DRAFT_777774 [Mycena maculata]|uniref:Uncharacterized protein n=1 Tax=Mycena maculata TaxID=230809 RepID=A0AAD7N229_9AGAR|nr:hypothetical protein DFH07DRAFT_777774 [Mycena maculata]
MIVCAHPNVWITACLQPCCRRAPGRPAVLGRNKPTQAIAVGPAWKTPRVANQAKANVPICIPWTWKPIFLGKSLAISTQLSVELHPSPLEPPDHYIFEPTDATNSFRQVHATASYEHMDVNFNVEAGGSVLGAFVWDQFVKNVAQNRDSPCKPRFTLVRLHLALSQNSPLVHSHCCVVCTSLDTVHAAYGSYFVYALSIGADTSTFLSTSTSFDLTQELRDIQVKAKGNMRPTDADLFCAIQLEELVDRVKDTLKGIGLNCQKETPLTREQIDATFAKGLVAEAVLSSGELINMFLFAV